MCLHISTESPRYLIFLITRTYTMATLSIYLTQHVFNKRAGYPSCPHLGSCKVIAKPTRQHFMSWPYLFKRNALFHSPLSQFCTSPSPPVMTYSSHLPPWKFPYGITTLSVHTLNFLNYSIAVSLSANVNPYIIRSPAAVSLLEQIINSHMHASYLLFHWASNKPIGLLPMLSPSQPATIAPPSAAIL